MNSRALPSFWRQFYKLSKDTQALAEKQFLLWLDNPQHPSLHFKMVSASTGVYSARVSLNCRALALRDGDTYYWYWIGTHAEYDHLLKQF
ncbi:MAG: hypothetical protein GKR94_11645 [Gammaproteobacteria bacterium]|nr:hypothetical protein [Gammaproteobacteria bacterium]